MAFARGVATAAQAQGVKRFVYHSVLHPQIEAMPHHWRKMRTEEMLIGLGLELTILQPAAYMQNILSALPGIVAEGVLRVPYPVTTRLSLVDLQDVAEVAAVVLTAAGHGGATYELAGSEPISQTEVAAAIGTSLKIPVRAEAESVEILAGEGARRRHGRVRMRNAHRHVPLLRRSRLDREFARPGGVARPAAERSCRVFTPQCGEGGRVVELSILTFA